MGGKVHIDNISSSNSLLSQGFEIYESYKKEVKRDDFELLSSQQFFSENGKKNAIISLKKLNPNNKN